MRHAAPRTAAVGGRPVRPVLFFHANTSKHGFFIGFHPSYRSIHAPYRSGVWLMDLRGPFRSRFLRNGSGRYAVSARRLAVVRGRSHRGTARNAHRRASARCRPLCRGRCRRLLQLFGRPVFRSQTFRRPNSRIFKRSYLDKTCEFYRKYGGKTVVLARFVPIVRTFAPFVAGMGRMHFPHFMAFNLLGGGAWVVLFCYAGYLFGDLHFVQRNLELLVVAIVIVSMLPAIVEAIRSTRRVRSA